MRLAALLLLAHLQVVLPALFRIESEPDWSFVRPSDASRWLYKAVSLVDMNQFGSTGDFVPYDCVLLLVNGDSKNVSAAAEDSYHGDVVVGEYSLKEVGDSLLLGGAQPPLTSYFWLQQLGSGGAIEWSYSTGAGSWALVNGAGQPSSGAVLGAGGRFDLDRGGDYAPSDATGLDAAGNPNANRATWWKTAGESGGVSTPLPADLAKMTVPGGGATPLYWLRGQVTKAFATPPVISQVYDRPDFGELLSRKYGGKERWAAATAQRLSNWGFTAAGQYSYAYPLHPMILLATDQYLYRNSASASICTVSTGYRAEQVLGRCAKSRRFCALAGDPIMANVWLGRAR